MSENMKPVDETGNERPKSDGVYKSRVYTDIPDYADYIAPKKFQAIQAR